MGLCKAIEGKEYVIYSWEEVAACYDKDVAPEEVKAFFEEVRLNQCINQKYADSDEVCFALTDKARLIKQDVEILAKAEAKKEKVIKTDESGNSVIVIPKTTAEVKTMKRKPMGIRLLGFLYGILGGLLGGSIICAIMYLVQSLGA